MSSHVQFVDRWLTAVEVAWIRDDSLYRTENCREEVLFGYRIPDGGVGGTIGVVAHEDYIQHEFVDLLKNRPEDYERMAKLFVGIPATVLFRPQPGWFSMKEDDTFGPTALMIRVPDGVFSIRAYLHMFLGLARAATLPALYDREEEFNTADPRIDRALEGDYELAGTILTEIMPQLQTFSSAFYTDKHIHFFAYLVQNSKERKAFKLRYWDGYVPILYDRPNTGLRNHIGFRFPEEFTFKLGDCWFGNTVEQGG